MDLRFTGRVVHWRGPAPWYFVAVPDAESERIAQIAGSVTYGWGAIPATATVGSTTWTTSLFPKDGGYLLPLKADVRRATGLDRGDAADVTLTIG